ncbi:MAG: hypothetical protein N838_23415 [Thiohalocapsa sp. PB-PSB1]|nr:MAG: hypothetical protein N838_01075 [Thiohalocapsa sp. PB-PSB1]QQO51983.1 MAG: hypothetical protein N838_23415 [Thiohalocapsa sp. PB-PSB1]
MSITICTQPSQQPVHGWHVLITFFNVQTFHDVECFHARLWYLYTKPGTKPGDVTLP